MRCLRIEYDGAVLFDGEVGEVTWTATDEGISVQGRVPGAPPPRRAKSESGAAAAGLVGKLIEGMATKRAQPSMNDDLAEVSSTP
jgi:hypothetical protein